MITKLDFLMTAKMAFGLSVVITQLLQSANAQSSRSLNAPLPAYYSGQVAQLSLSNPLQQGAIQNGDRGVPAGNQVVVATSTPIAPPGDANLGEVYDGLPAENLPTAGTKSQARNTETTAPVQMRRPLVTPTIPAETTIRRSNVNPPQVNARQRLEQPSAKARAADNNAKVDDEDMDEEETKRTKRTKRTRTKRTMTTNFAITWKSSINCFNQRPSNACSV